MKLFIPTCTLNFNNIFSTESISPSSFYQKRGFGNKRFYSVPANNLDDVIILYSKYPHYSLENSDLENYPMVIEINTTDYADGFFVKVAEKDNVEVFVCSQTIYLNPFHCFVYFDSYESRQGAQTKAEQSLENKYSKLYQANLLVKEESKKSLLSLTNDLFSTSEQNDFTWSSSFLNFDLPEIVSNYKLDVIYDRVKGFIFCYLIGANQSVSTETGRLKSIARNLRNILSAVVNSPDKKPSAAQDNALVAGIKEFNNIYSSKDEDYIHNKIIVGNRLKSNSLGISIDDCIKLLNEWNLYEYFCAKLNLKKVYNAGELWTCLEYPGLNGFTQVIDNMNNAVKKLENNDLSNNTKNKISDLIMIESGQQVKILDNSYRVDFYQSLINSQINADYLNIMIEQDVEEQLAQAFNGGKILKSIMGDAWNNSEISTYIENLLNHFQNNVPFDLFSFSNDVVMSFAAFCQKGDSIDRLSEYLIQCGFSNYRLSFGIYGATRGFASLPKTFTSSFINGDKDYYRDTFLYVYAQLMGIQIANPEYPQHKQSFETRVTENTIVSTIIDNISKIETKLSKQTSVIDAVTQAADLEYAVQSPRAFMFILDSFPRITITNAYKSLVKADFANDRGSYTPESFKNKIYTIIGKDAIKAHKEKIDRAIELEAKRQDPEAYLKILDNFMKPSDSAYKKIVKLILPTHKSETKSSESTSQSSQSTNDVASILPNIPSLAKFPQNAIRRLEQNWKYTGKTHPNDRRKHIQFFINLCKKEGRGQAINGPTALTGTFSEDLGNLIEQELHQYYHV